MENQIHHFLFLVTAGVLERCSMKANWVGWEIWSWSSFHASGQKTYIKFLVAVLYKGLSAFLIRLNFPWILLLLPVGQRLQYLSVFPFPFLPSLLWVGVGMEDIFLESRKRILTSQLNTLVKHHRVNLWPCGLLWIIYSLLPRNFLLFDNYKILYITGETSLIEAKYVDLVNRI